MKSRVSIYKHKAQIHLYLQLLNKNTYMGRKKGNHCWVGTAGTLADQQLFGKVDKCFATAVAYTAAPLLFK